MQLTMKRHWIALLALLLSQPICQVFAEDAPPTITFSVPSPQTVAEGATLSFDITVTDPEGLNPSLTFSNRPPGTFSYDGLAGAGTETGTVSITPSFGSHIFSPYDMAVVASDGTNPPVIRIMTIYVISNTNTVPLMITNAAYLNGNFHFEIIGLAGKTSRTVQASTNLIDWTTIDTYGFPDPGSFTDSDATNYCQRYYRVFQTR